MLITDRAAPAAGSRSSCGARRRGAAGLSGMRPHCRSAAAGARASAWPTASRRRQTPGERYYALADFPRVEKIDAHVHVHGAARRASWRRRSRDNFRILTINVDYPDFPALAEQQRDAVSLRQRYPGRVAFAATFSVQDFRLAGLERSAPSRQIDAAVAQGAVGVKIWKNIGMALRDADGRYVMPDDAASSRSSPSGAAAHRAARSTRPSRSTAGCPWRR